MTDLTQEEALSRAAELLDASDDYRVLRRLGERPNLFPPAEVKKAVLIDTETTGLDPAFHEIIELSIVPFTYTPDGRIYEVGPIFNGIRQPSHPIPPEMTAIHGITDDMVAGAEIDPAEVAAVIEGAAPVIAHHAEFDRPFVEKLFPAFAERPWACSQSQIDWRPEGFDGTSLAYLAMANGFFYDRHEATADCLAAIHLLERTLPKSGCLAMQRLLEKGRVSTWRIVAAGSPFPKKDVLKARGYRWNAERKFWYADVDDWQTESEWLGREIYGRSNMGFPVTKITAFERFSVRVG